MTIGARAGSPEIFRLFAALSSPALSMIFGRAMVKNRRVWVCGTTRESMFMKTKNLQIFLPSSSADIKLRIVGSGMFAKAASKKLLRLSVRFSAHAFEKLIAKCRALSRDRQSRIW